MTSGCFHHEQERDRILSDSGDPSRHLRVAARPVSTVVVKAVLMSFEYRQRDCDRVGRFARILSDGLDWLVAKGHPKWRSVDLAFPLKRVGAVRLRETVPR
jgi:hypothetical protein